MFRFNRFRQLTFVLALLEPAIALAAGNEASPPLAALTGKPGGLTADEVARRATDTSRAVQEKKHDLDAAQAEVDRTLADYFPRLDLSAGYSRLSRVKNESLGTVVFAPESAAGAVAPGEPLVAVPLEIDALENATTAASVRVVHAPVHQRSPESRQAEAPRWAVSAPVSAPMPRERLATVRSTRALVHHPQ